MNEQSDADLDSGSKDNVTWRQLRRGLWVGRADDQPIGVIEQGRRFTFTDADEQSHPGFVTLSAAQEAAAGCVQVIRTDGDHGAHRTPIALPPHSIAFLMLAAAVLAISCGLLLFL